MKTFNAMTEKEMSEVNGGIAMGVAFILGLIGYFGIPGLIMACVDKFTKGK